MYAVDVTITRTSGWTVSKNLPTFFIDENIQGVTTEVGVKAVVRRIVDPFDHLDYDHDILSITVVKLKEIIWEGNQ